MNDSRNRHTLPRGIGLAFLCLAAALPVAASMHSTPALATAPQCARADIDARFEQREQLRAERNQVLVDAQATQWGWIRLEHQNTAESLAADMDILMQENMYCLLLTK